MHNTHSFLRVKIFAALTAVVIAGVVFCCSKKAPEPDSAPEEVSAGPEDGLTDLSLSVDAEQAPAGTQAPGEIWVYVCGAVKAPGVYRLAEGARVFEAIEMAGGASADAREDSLNLAAPLADGQKVFVPDVLSAEEEAQPGEDGLEGPAQSGLVSLNRATLSELMTLPGIGEVKAQAIIDYREQHPFQSIEEIMNVSGIKENAFQKIRDRITVP